MEEEKLADALAKTTGLSKEDVRLLIREEINRKEEEKQEECDHSRSGKLIDGKKGIVRCNDCGKLIDMTEPSTSSSEIPPRMKAQIEQMMKKRSEKSKN